ncbi:MAG TPA: hypothetical protein VGR49_03295 [Actinomycetota bacterium]|jgi:hypothetical protein|nr:hypothetical protein [Actinomycetota bacterium]
MEKRERRVHDAEAKAERRLRPTREREPAPGGPSREVLRLQRLAGNSAVNVLLRSPALQRDGGGAPAPAGEKPKQSGLTVIVADKDIGSFVALSAAFSGVSSGASGTGKVPNEVVITKKVDELSPVLMQRSASGPPFASVVINFPGLPFVMKEVYITSYSISSGQEPVESMIFSGKEPEKEK